MSEQIESTHAAYEAGASIVHAHVRNNDETPSSDPEKFSALKEGLEKHCPEMIIQFSTSGRSGSGQARGAMRQNEHQLFLCDREGQMHQIEAQGGQSAMEALRRRQPVDRGAMQ